MFENSCYIIHDNISKSTKVLLTTPCKYLSEKCPATMIDDVVSPDALQVTADVNPDSAPLAISKTSPVYTATADPNTYTRLTVIIRSKKTPKINKINFVVFGVEEVYYIIQSPVQTYPSPKRTTDPTKQSIVTAIFEVPIEADTLTVYLKPVSETTEIEVSQLEIVACYEPGLSLY